MDWKPSPNYYRTPLNKPQYFIIHVTDGSYPGAIQWLCNPKSKASAHFVVARDGRCTKLVDEKYGAWHSGIREWNLKSIGIEHEGIVSKGTDYWTDIEMDVTATIMAAEHKTWGIPLDREHVKGHGELKPKICPGHLKEGLDELIKRARIKAGLDSPTPTPIPEPTPETEQPSQIEQLNAEIKILTEEVRVLKENEIARLELILKLEKENDDQGKTILAQDQTIKNQANQLSNMANQPNNDFKTKLANKIKAFFASFKWNSFNINSGLRSAGISIGLGLVTLLDSKQITEWIKEYPILISVYPALHIIINNWLKNFIRKLQGKDI